MPFRPNYRGDRLERDRAARDRTEEKQKKRDEKSAKRKAERAEAQGPLDNEQPQHQADPRQKACPRTDYLRSYYLATDGRVRCSIDSMSLILAKGLPYNDAALDSAARHDLDFVRTYRNL